MSDANDLQQPTAADPPEDFRAYEAWREAGGGNTADPDVDTKTPTAGDEEEPSSEPSDETDEDLEGLDLDEDGQIAEESDPEDVTEQEKTQAQLAKSQPNKRLAKRMRDLTGKIKQLESQLAGLDQSESDEEADEEVVSSTDPGKDEPSAESKTLTRPRLKNFEDTEELDAWEQYEAAMDEYYAGRMTAAVSKAIQAERAETETKQQAAVREALWNKAASRFPDYNEVVTDGVWVSKAMEDVLRMDPESGTELAYYLGQHPEESEALAKETLAPTEKQWPQALARAGMRLGEIRAKLAAEKKTTTPKPSGGNPPVRPPAPPLKKVSDASRPPTQIRGTPAPPAFDVNNDDDARNYKRWESARNAQLAKSGKR